MPVLATCAGLILLADNIEGREAVHLRHHAHVTVKQKCLWTTAWKLPYRRHGLQGCRQSPDDLHPCACMYQKQCMTDDVQVLATVEDRIVAVQYKNQLASAFHPELDENDEIHKAFLAMCENRKPL